MTEITFTGIGDAPEEVYQAWLSGMSVHYKNKEWIVTAIRTDRVKLEIVSHEYDVSEYPSPI